MIMIDWVSCLIPWKHDKPINDGNIVSIDPDGSISWQTEKWLSVPGSYESSVQVRSHHSETECSHIMFSGNPVKFLQGHNIWGTGDLGSLTIEAFFKCLRHLGITDDGCLPKYPHSCVYSARLTRIDLAAMFHMDNAKSVNSWLRSAEFSANLRHRGKGQMTNGTLYFGKHSRRWSLKFYHKGQEVRDNKKHQRELPDSLLQFADKSLRAEIVLRGKELDKLGLSVIGEWDNVNVEDVYNSYLSRLELSENMTSIDPEKLADLPPRLKGVYRCWENGDDMRQMYSKSTFYRYRRQMLDALNIDISVKQSGNKEDRSNVVPLVRVLEAKPAEIPEWAYGTDFYHEPAHYPRLIAV